MAEIKLKVVPDTSQLKSELRDIERQIKGVSRTKVKLEAEKSKIDNAKKELEDINRQISELNSKKINLQANEQAYQKIVKELSNVKREIKELDAQRLELKADGKPIEDIVSKIDKLKAKKIRLELEKQGLETAHKDLIQVNKDLADLNKQKAQLEVRIQNGEKVEKDLNEVEKELNELNGKKAEMTLQLNGLEQLKSNIKSAQSTIKNFGKGMETVGNSMLNMFSINSHTPIGKFAHFITKGIGYSTLYRGATAGMNAFNESLSGSVERFDAIRRGVNVMKQLRDETGANYSDASINSLIEGLSDNILGLPTTLNDAISHTKDLVSVTGDLERSKDIYTALNDAVLSFGGTEENVQRVMSQFIVSLGRGKVDGRAFRSMLQNGMTPALNEVAKSLGRANAGELQEALSKGTISAEQFTDALIDLDKNGSAGMNSLREMVYESVDTFQGAFSLLKMRLTAGMTDILTAINDTFGEMFGTNLIDSVKNFGTGIRESLQGVAEWIKQHKDEIKGFLELIAQKFQEVMNVVGQFNLGSFIDGLKMAKPIIDTAIGTIKLFVGAFKSVLEIIGGGDISKGLGRFIVGWYSFGFALKGVGKMLQLVSGPLGTLIGTLQTFGRLPALSGNSFLGKLFSGKAFKPQVEGGASGGDLFGTENMVASLKKSVANLVKVGALCLELVMVAKTLKTVDQELNGIDWLGLAGKITGMVVVIGSIELIAGVSGKIINSFGLLDEIVTGLLTMIGSGGTLWLMAKAVQEVDNIEIKDISAKIDAIMEAVIKISLLATAIGGIHTVTGGITAGFALAGGATMLGVAGVLIAIAKAVQELDKIKISDSDITKKIGQIETVLQAIAGLSFEFSIKGAGDTEKVKQVMKDLVSVAKSSVKLAKQDVSVDGVKEKVNKLGEVISALNENFGVDATSGWKALDVTNIQDSIKAIKELNKLPQKIIDFTTTMDTLGSKFDGDKAQAYAETISEAVGSIRGSINAQDFNGFVDLEVIKNAKKSIDQLPKLLESMMTLKDTYNATTFDPGYMEFVVGQISKCIQAFDDKDLLDSASSISTYAERFTNVNSAIDTLKTMVTKLQELNTTFVGLAQGGKSALSTSIIKNGITKVKDAFTEIKALVDQESPLTRMSNDVNVDFATVLQKVIDLQSIIAKLNELSTEFAQGGMATFDTKAFGDGIKKINDAVEQLPTKEEINVDEIIDFSELNTKVTVLYDSMNSIVTQLNQVTGLTLNEGIKEKVEQIRTAIDDLTNAFTEPANANGAMSAVTSSDSAGQNIATGIVNMVTAIKSAVDTLNSIEFTQTGTSFAQQIVDGFGDVDIETSITTPVSNALKSLAGKVNGFRTVGTGYGNNLKSGFNSAINSLGGSIVNKAMTMVNAGSGAFRNAGIRLGQQIIAGLESSLSRGVTVQVTASTHMKHGGLVGSGVTAIGSIMGEIKSRMANMLSTGGEVRYMAKGGMLTYFEPKGVDTIPAMLQPGEFVMRKRTVDRYGQRFFDYLNHGDLTSALRTVTNRDMATTTQSITYNTINNNNSVYTDNRSVKVYGSNERSQRLKAGRFLRGLA